MERYTLLILREYLGIADKYLGVIYANALMGMSVLKIWFTSILMISSAWKIEHIWVQ